MCAHESGEDGAELEEGAEDDSEGVELREDPEHAQHPQQREEPHGGAVVVGVGQRNHDLAQHGDQGDHAVEAAPRPRP